SRRYDMNKNKNDLEIIMGYFLYKLWDKGIVHVRTIKNPVELAEQVEKDIAKRTGTEGFKANKRKYGFSRGLKTREVKKEKEYEWAGNVESVSEAKDLLESTRENFVDHFNMKTYDGEMIYERMIMELDGLETKKKESKQVGIDEF
ncbi:MAG: hypothetical protein ACFFAO_06580, partial [Candidatus Hermodarchaeota archaeon]